MTCVASCTAWVCMQHVKHVHDYLRAQIGSLGECNFVFADSLCDVLTIRACTYLSELYYQSVPLRCTTTEFDLPLVFLYVCLRLLWLFLTATCILLLLRIHRCKRYCSRRHAATGRLRRSLMHRRRQTLEQPVRCKNTAHVDTSTNHKPAQWSLT